jgi:hypothetical protein
MITGYTYYDANKNGTFDPGEGVPHKQLDLYRIYDDGSWDTIGQTETDDNGYYGMVVSGTLPPTPETITRGVKFKSECPDPNNWIVSAWYDIVPPEVRLDVSLGDSSCLPPSPLPTGKVCPRTPGFWKQQVNQSRAAKFTQEEINTLMDAVLGMTSVFRTHGEIVTALNVKQTGSSLEGARLRAKRQFAAFSLNLAAGFIFMDTPLDPKVWGSVIDPDVWGSLEKLEVGDAYKTAEALILDCHSNKNMLEWAYTISEWINEGYGVVGYYGEDD